MTLSVLALAVGVCAAGRAVLCGAVDAAERLRAEAVLALDEGDAGRCGEALARMATLWEERRALLEMIASHDALHEVKVALSEASICLGCGDRDDFLRNMAIAAEGLAHLRDEQDISLENLY